MSSGLVFAKAAASQRASSQDRAAVLEHGDTLIVVLADGAGGMTGGAVASAVLVDAVLSQAERAAFDPYDASAWLELLETVDSDLSRRMAGETTALVVAVGPRGIVGVSAGDSEAWVVSTSLDGLTDAQHRRRLGSGRAQLVPFERDGLDGVLVIGTDGLFKAAGPDAIHAAIHATCGDAFRAAGAEAGAAGTGAGTGAAAAVLPALAEHLVDLTRLRSGDHADDVTVVVVARDAMQ